MSDRTTLLDRLRDVHEFPGPYVFKVIGANSESFVTRVVQTAVNTLGRGADPDVSTRESRKGNHLSVTLSVTVQDAESVLEVYAAFKHLDDVRYIL